jgi:hypothetical protein
VTIAINFPDTFSMALVIFPLPSVIERSVMTCQCPDAILQAVFKVTFESAVSCHIYANPSLSAVQVVAHCESQILSSIAKKQGPSKSMNSAC